MRPDGQRHWIDQSRSEKAEQLHLPRLQNYSDIMAVMTLLEARYVQDADVYVERILKIPEDRLEYYVLWMALRAKAYILFRHGDLKKSIHFLKQAKGLSKRYGWPLYRGSWNLECIRGIEAQDNLPNGISLQSEIELLLKWPDIYMQGVALRYRAEELFKSKGDNKIIMKDLNKSLRLLSRSGAKLEAAKTKNEIARVLFDKGEKISALKLWTEAWEVMSPVNRKLFPDDLKKYIRNSDREERIITTIVEVSNNLGAIRNLKELLDWVISLIMEFTGAERCGIFLSEHKDMILVASRNLNQSVIQSKGFKQNLRVVEKVVNSGRSILHGMESMNNGNKKEPVVTDWMICSPIVLKSNVIGAIYLDADKIESAITNQDLKLLGAINNQIAISIDNARAYEEVSRLKDRLKEETRFYRMDPSSTMSSGEIIGKSEAIFKGANTRHFQNEHETLGGVPLAWQRPGT
jgi:tetratricopeptide (TPR) repeat protein